MQVISQPGRILFGRSSKAFYGCTHLPVRKTLRTSKGRLKASQKHILKLLPVDVPGVKGQALMRISLSRRFSYTISSAFRISTIRTSRPALLTLIQTFSQRGTVGWQSITVFI